MSQSRQLAAIMFTDIVGYTALMGSDDKKALAILNKNRELQKPIIDEFNGRWIKELGDGVMASFNSAADAVYAAIKIQEECNVSKEFQLKIGIHLGDVLFENDDVFGDGVNIAARIQAAAKPGCIFISETVHHNISNKIEIKSQFVKEEILKNVSQPVRMYQVLTSGSKVILANPSGEISFTNAGNKIINPAKRSWKMVSIGFTLMVLALVAYFFYQRKPTYEPTEKERSIAVLPFVNMSNDAEQEFFSDGISEEIINVLAQAPGLKVVGRTSSFAFKGKNQDLKFIGEQLNVSHILEGSVRRSGNKLRITAQLIKVADGYHLYSETFDRELEDIFSIQDQISLAIFSAIKIQLLDEMKDVILRKYTDNIEAYQLYLKGRASYNKYTRESFIKAIDFFKEAIKLDSNYAIAYSGMSYCYLTLWQWNWLPAEQSLPQALEAAQRSLMLDSVIAESHLQVGRVKLHYEWNLMEAQKEFKKAISINPNSAECHVQLGMLAIQLGNIKEALVHARQAESLDPYSPMNLWMTNIMYFFANDMEKVLKNGKRLVELAPDFFAGYFWQGLAYLQLQKFQEGIAACQLAAKHENGPLTLSTLGEVYGLMGDKAQARKIISTMKNMEGIEKVGNNFIASVYGSMGEMDSAFFYYDKAIANHEGHLIWKKFETPLFVQDPRTKKLIEKIGIPTFHHPDLVK